MQAQFNYNQVSGQPVIPQVLGQAIGGLQQAYAKFTSDPFAGVQTLTINQEPDCVECVCPCLGEKRNFYHISASDPTGVMMLHQLGRIEEFSECPQRFFCQCWRAFELSFMTPQGQVVFTAKSSQFPYLGQYKVPSVLCCPCERPELLVSQNNQMIGYVKQPFMCCGRSECPFPLFEEIDIVDAVGNTKYYISGEFIQCGCVTRICMIPRCTGPCQFINFEIYNSSKQKVGQIRNVFNGCINEYCSKADKFVIDFPQGCDTNDKILITLAAITIDYDCFEYTFCNLP